MKKIMLMACLLAGAFGCGHYNSQLNGLKLYKYEPKASETLEDWSRDTKLINEAMYKIPQRWGRGSYSYFAETFYKADKKTVESYRIKICKIEKEGTAGADPGCTTGNGYSPKEALEDAYKKELGP